MDQFLRKIKRRNKDDDFHLLFPCAADCHRATVWQGQRKWTDDGRSRSWTPLGGYAPPARSKALSKKTTKTSTSYRYYRVIKQQSEILIDQLHQVGPYIVIPPYDKYYSITNRAGNIFAINHLLNSAAARLRSAEKESEHGVPIQSCLFPSRSPLLGPL